MDLNNIIELKRTQKKDRTELIFLSEGMECVVELIDNKKNGSCYRAIPNTPITEDVALEGKYEFKDDMLHGDFIKFDNHGRVLIEGSYKNNKLDGNYKEFRYYNKKKCLILECKYTNDILDGEYTEYYGNGNLKKQMHIKNGVKHGEYSSYNTDCHLKLKVMFDNDYIVGNGVLITEIDNVTNIHDIYSDVYGDSINITADIERKLVKFIGDIRFMEIDTWMDFFMTSTSDKDEILNDKKYFEAFMIMRNKLKI